MQCRACLVGVIAVLGCDAAGSDDGETTTGELPSPYAEDGDESGQAVPSLGPEQVAGFATAGLAGFVALRPEQVVDAYLALAITDEGCPEQLDEVVDGGTTVQLWYSDGCTTAAGTSFAGGGRLERYTIMEDGYQSTGATLNAEGPSFSIATADGRSLHLEGAFGHSRGTDGVSTDASIEIYGHARADAETAAGSPLLDGSVSAQGYMYSYADADTKVLGGEGAWSGAALGDARAFSFAGVAVYSVVCTAEPSGTLSVRDAEGFWHDIVFDGITVVDYEPTFVEGLCDGCGSYLAAGAPAGEACVAASELAAVLDWEDYAW
jgi:hypothetical protein